MHRHRKALELANGLSTTNSLRNSLHLAVHTTQTTHENATCRQREVVPRRPASTEEEQAHKYYRETQRVGSGTIRPQGNGAPPWHTVDITWGPKSRIFRLNLAPHSTNNNLINRSELFVAVSGAFRSPTSLKGSIFREHELRTNIRRGWLLEAIKQICHIL